MAMPFLRLLHHSNIVSLLGYSVGEKHVVLIMNFVDGMHSSFGLKQLARYCLILFVVISMKNCLLGLKKEASWYCTACCKCN